MKLFSILIVSFCLISCSDESSILELDSNSSTAFIGELEFVQSYGGSGEDTAQAIVATDDGGYAVLGFSNSTDGDLSGKTTAVNDYWLLKLDADGNLEWSKTYGGSKDDRGQSLIQTKDGGYALTGYAMSDDGDSSVNKGFHDNWLLKLNSFGKIEWEKSFGFSGHDHSYDLLETDDGGFFFVGFLDITSARADGNTVKGNTTTLHGVGEFWGTKIDASANLQWRGYYGGSSNDRAHSVVQADDGGYVMAGFTESNDFDIDNSRGSYDYWVVKVDALGNFKWQNSFGGTGIERAQDIAKTDDGGYVIVGNTFSNDSDISETKGESDIWMVKINDQGQLVWDASFGGSKFDAAQSVTLSQDGGFIIAGNTKSTDQDVIDNSGENDIWLLKTNANGKMVWQKTFGGQDLDYGFDVLETFNGAVVLVGETASSNFDGLTHKGGKDAVIIKLK